MAKKITSCILIAISLVLLSVIILGERKLVSESFAKYEPATRPEEIVCRVYLGNAVNDVRIVSTEVGYVLFLPTGTENIEFANIPGDKVINCDSSGTVELNFKNGTKYDISQVEAAFDALNRTSGRELFKVMASQNVSSVFITSGDSIDVIDAEWKKPHSASATIVDESGSVIFTGALEYIEPRGNSSFLLDKKSYEIKFKKAQNLVNDAKEKEWLLLNGGHDDTLIRNAVIYNFANEYTSVKAPVGRFADLYINGEYRGNYYLSQKAKNVNPRGEDEGYLLKHAEAGRTEEDPVVSVGLGYDFNVVSPKDVTDDDLLYISDFLNILERAAASEDGVDPETGTSIDDCLDLDSWTDKLLIENMFQNVDSYVNSSFFFLEKGKNGGKLFAGPAWDYDMTATGIYDVWNIEQSGNLYLRDLLLKNPKVKELLKTKFETLIKPYVKYKLSSDVYEQYDSNRYSYEMDSVLWNREDERFLDDFIKRSENRLEVIEKRILGNTTEHVVSFYDYEGLLLKRVFVKDGEAITDIPVCASYIALFNGWYESGTGAHLKEGEPVWEDKDYYGIWIEVPIIIKNALMSLGIDINNLNEESVNIIAEYYKSKLDNPESLLGE